MSLRKYENRRAQLFLTRRKTGILTFRDVNVRMAVSSHCFLNATEMGAFYGVRMNHILTPIHYSLHCMPRTHHTSQHRVLDQGRNCFSASFTKLTLGADKISVAQSVNRYTPLLHGVFSVVGFYLIGKRNRRKEMPYGELRFYLLIQN